MIHRRYCTSCKRTDVPLINISKNPKKTIQYYICRECNAIRRRRYASTAEGKKRIYIAAKRNREKDPRKVMARYIVRYAVMIGYIEKPVSCPTCGGNTKRIEAHHTDYNKALDIQWLCSSCHANIHNMKVRENSNK